MLVSLLCVCRCVFLLGGMGGPPLRYGHNEIYKDRNLKKKTQPHEYQSDALTTELSGDLMSRV